MTKGILDRLSEGVVLGDGGYLLELERRGYVQAGSFVPEVLLTRPEALAELHRMGEG
jgi:betaine-homocysteine S-methyltransferase